MLIHPSAYLPSAQDTHPFHAAVVKVIQVVKSPFPHVTLNSLKAQGSISSSAFTALLPASH